MRPSCCICNFTLVACLRSCARTTWQIILRRSPTVETRGPPCLTGCTLCIISTTLLSLGKAWATPSYYSRLPPVPVTSLNSAIAFPGLGLPGAALSSPSSLCEDHPVVLVAALGFTRMMLMSSPTLTHSRLLFCSSHLFYDPDSLKPSNSPSLPVHLPKCTTGEGFAQIDYNP